MKKLTIAILSVLAVIFLTAQTCSSCFEGEIVCEDTEAYECQRGEFGNYKNRAPEFDISECGAEKTCSSQDDCSEGYCIAGVCETEMIITACSTNADCNTGDVCLPGYNICYAEPAVSCRDTDSLNDPTVLGKIYGLSFTDEEEAEGEEDICADDGTGPWEFYCDEESDYITAEFVACDDGMICSNGICQETEGTRCMSTDDCSDDEVCAPYTDTCQEAPTTGCVDTDEANDLYTAGTISGASDYDSTDITDWSDRCTPDRESVIEYYCHESGYVAAERVACDTGEFCNPSLGVCETAITSGLLVGSREAIEIESREMLIADTADMIASRLESAERVEVSSTMSNVMVSPQSIMTRSVVSSGSSTSYTSSSSIFSSGVTSITRGVIY